MQKWGQVSGGVNVELAARPFGRAAGINANISANGITPNYTYSHSKGLFGGVGLQGSGIMTRADLNKKFYGREISPEEILSGAVDQPATAMALYDALDQALLQRTPDLPSVVDPQDADVMSSKVLMMVQSMSGAQAVDTFKLKCKEYGQTDGSDQSFLTYLQTQFNETQLRQLVPDLVQLVPQRAKRQQMWTLYTQIRLQQASKTTMDPAVSILF